MGYYTRYSLSVQDGNGKEVYDTSEIEEKISAISGYGSCFEDEIKWYTHDNDMRTVSKMYPDLLFILSGEEEESGDLWKSYYKNGKVHTAEAKIVFDPFDESKLKCQASILSANISGPLSPPQSISLSDSVERLWVLRKMKIVQTDTPITSSLLMEKCIGTWIVMNLS